MSEDLFFRLGELREWVRGLRGDYIRLGAIRPERDSPDTDTRERDKAELIIKLTTLRRALIALPPKVFEQEAKTLLLLCDRAIWSLRDREVRTR